MMNKPKARKLDYLSVFHDETASKRRLEIDRAKTIVKFLGDSPFGSTWGSEYVIARNTGDISAEFRIYDKFQSVVLSEISRLEFIHAMNRVLYSLRDSTYLYPHERGKGIQS
jgi:hypothetical protein